MVTYKTQGSQMAIKDAGSTNRLETVKNISQIFGAIATPIAVAVIGLLIQSKIATEANKKDYVQMSLNILETSSKDEQLRKWAVDILGTDSPVPFSTPLKNALINGTSIVPLGVISNVPPWAMQPPKEWKPLPNDPKLSLDDAKKVFAEDEKIDEDKDGKLAVLQYLLTSLSKPSALPAQPPTQLAESSTTHSP
jgi:hypothetical protein